MVVLDNWPGIDSAAVVADTAVGRTAAAPVVGNYSELLEVRNFLQVLDRTPTDLGGGLERYQVVGMGLVDLGVLLQVLGAVYHSCLGSCGAVLWSREAVGTCFVGSGGCS